MKRPNILRSASLRTAAVAMVCLGTLGVLMPSTAMASSSTNTVNSSWPTTLTMAGVGFSNSDTLYASLAPIVALVKKQLDVTLTMQNSTSYASVIEAQEAGKVQIAEYGPFSYFIAVNQGIKLENIGIDLTAPNTNGGYYSEAVINPKLTPDITSVKDFKGKKVCFSDPSSTSGYLYPTYGLLQNGINPSTGVTPVFSGSDTATAVAVAKGECQVGYTNNINEEDAVATHLLNPKDIKMVWQSPEIPGSPDAVSMSVPASLRAALKTLFVNEANSTYLSKHGYCKSAAACTLIMGQWGFGSPAGWSTAPIKKVCQLTKSPACTTA